MFVYLARNFFVSSVLYRKCTKLVQTAMNGSVLKGLPVAFVIYPDIRRSQSAALRRRAFSFRIFGVLHGQNTRDASVFELEYIGARPGNTVNTLLDAYNKWHELTMPCRIRTYSCRGGFRMRTKALELTMRIGLLLLLLLARMLAPVVIINLRATDPRHPVTFIRSWNSCAAHGKCLFTFNCRGHQTRNARRRSIPLSAWRQRTPVAWARTKVKNCILNALRRFGR
jgi:hypothetical protein